MTIDNLARDRRIAWENHPEDTHRVETYLYYLRTDFRRALHTCFASGYLIPVDPAGNVFLLIHEFGKSKVGLYVQCNEATEEVAEVAFYFPQARRSNPPKSDRVLRLYSGVPDGQEQQPANNHEDQACTHTAGMFWGFGYDHAKGRRSG